MVASMMLGLVGVLVLLVGHILLAIAAFHQGRWWGWTVLLFPPAALFFLLTYWSDGKTAFVVQVTGFILLAGGAGCALGAGLLSRAEAAPETAGPAEFEERADPS